MAYFFLLGKSQPALPVVEVQYSPTASNEISISLFYPKKDASDVISFPVQVPDQTKNPSAWVAEIVQNLSVSPDPQVLPIFSGPQVFRNALFGEEGILYIDVWVKSLSVPYGGVRLEELAILALKRSLGTNIPGLKAIKILGEGNDRDVFLVGSGHTSSTRTSLANCYIRREVRQLLPGFNHNIRHRELLFHVQTEDSGERNPYIVTTLFYEGNVMASRRSNYTKFLQAGDRNEIVKSMMQEQHKEMMKDLAADRLRGVAHLFPDVVPAPVLQRETVVIPPSLGVTKENKAGNIPTIDADGTLDKTLDELILEFLQKENAK